MPIWACWNGRLDRSVAVVVASSDTDVALPSLLRHGLKMPASHIDMGLLLRLKVPAANIDMGVISHRLLRHRLKMSAANVYMRSVVAHAIRGISVRTIAAANRNMIWVIHEPCAPPMLMGTIAAGVEKRRQSKSANEHCHDAGNRAQSYKCPYGRNEGHHHSRDLHCC